MIIAVVLIPVILIAVATGFFVFRGAFGGPSVEVAQNSGVPELTFPDPQSLDFSTLEGTTVDEVMDSADGFRMCETVAKTMRTRGYDLAASNPQDNGGSCRFYTPGLSLLTKGSYNLMADVGLWQGDSETMYESHLTAAGENAESDSGRSSYKHGKPEEFPVGEEGFIHHDESAEMGRSDAKAVFRSDDFLMLVAVWGSVHTPDGGVEEMPLGKDVTYGEITDIVTALSGDGEPGQPRISEPKLKKHPELAGLSLPAVPDVEGREPEAVCGELASAAERLGVRLTSADSQGGATSLDYICSSPEISGLEGPEKREFTIVLRDFHSIAKTRPAGELGRDAQSRLRDFTADGEKYTEPADAAMYDVPFGDFGYAFYEDTNGYGRAYLGYVIDDVYVKLELTGYRTVGYEGVALEEDVLMKDLARFLSALD